MAIDHPVVIITGAGAGIGKACAIRFAQEGARVVVVDRAEADGQGTVDLLKSRGAEAIFVHSDVSMEEECRRFAEEAVDAFGRIDILVANAGIRAFGTVLDATEQDWDRILGVNLKGVSFSCKAVLPRMIEQNSGAIVLIGSTTALTGRTNMPLYDATKFGVLSLTRSLAATYGKNGIRTNAVCPSFTLTDFHFRKAAAEGISPQELRERHQGYGLLGRPGEPEDIAAAVYFMAGKDASFITGQYLIVDGGFSIGSKTG
ncbi:MAG: SDR family oxidoreductase [Deltaproteobacteria bacterium]|nr:MAG: SDR family oxidoreductase [Deltaproteobacteria bacterium]